MFGRLLPWRRPQKKPLLFHRDFRNLSGGHLKVWHYFSHSKHSKYYSPRIHFSSETQWNDTNPWYGMRDEVEAAWAPENAAALFLAGMDWQLYSRESEQQLQKPVINLVQHVRHANPKFPVHEFLSRRAIRICVSQQVADAIQATGRANGPVFTIENGLDLESLPAPSKHKKPQIHIFGLKVPALAQRLYQRLAAAGVSVRFSHERLPRQEYLGLMNESEIVLPLPGRTEGFFLPALEAMALGSVVVCPDCVGNRGFCHDQVNCLMPSYSEDALFEACLAASRLTLPEKQRLIRAGHETLQRHGLERERQQFLDILDNCEQIWASGQ